MYKLITILVLLLITNIAFPSTVFVDEPNICLICHDDFESVLEKSNVHTALSKGKCSACHNPHASQHSFLLNDTVQDLCFKCHEDIKNSLGSAHNHSPAAKGNCLVCHDPHASDFKNNLHRKTTDLCTECHSSVSQWSSRKVLHKPFANGECVTCHTSHGSDEDNLLQEKLPDLCIACHSNNARFKQAHQGYQLADSKCTTCHDPHSSSLPSLIMPNQHEPFASKQCNACHSSGTNVSGMALTGKVLPVCTRCHTDLKDDLSITQSAHISSERSCLNCHNAHASSTNSLLSEEQQVVCLRCHFSEDKYIDKPKESILTHNGMDCTECHQPHGSDSDNYFIKTGSELCTGCHEGAHSSSHPLGPDVIDKRTGEQVTCLSCHQLHGASFEPYLPLSPEMELCIQCHRQ